MDNTNKMDENQFNELDLLYRKLKTIDKSSMSFSRITENIKIKEAMEAYIASFGLSMIKDIYLNNTNSVGFMMSIRCILEGIAVYLYTNKSEITEENKYIFKLQALHLEKEIYRKYPVFDGQLFNIKEITKNYQNFKKNVMNMYGVTSKSLNKVLQSIIPFLGHIKSFESLIQDNLSSDMLLFYKTSSLFVHPYDYRFGDSEIFSDFSQIALELMNYIFDNIEPDPFGLEEEYFLNIDSNIISQRVRLINNEQWEKTSILARMLDENGFHFLAFSLDKCSRILGDYFLDIALGYVEQPTIKWKAVIENLWMLNLSITDDTYGKGNILMHYHTLIKTTVNIGDEITDQDFEEAYQSYKSKYPQGCEFELFKKSFISTTGYTINEKGETISLKKAVFSLIDELSPSITEGKLLAQIKKGPILEPSDTNDLDVLEIDINSYLKMKYEESQAMSHATGYLYYCLNGAWHDGIGLAYLYEEMYQLLLRKLFNKLQTLNKSKLIDKTPVNYLRKFLNENKKTIIEKKKLYFLPKVEKPF